MPSNTSYFQSYFKKETQESDDKYKLSHDDDTDKFYPNYNAEIKQ